MSSKIRVLNDHTINKIAAGEVIENPASVVKELVENSIDAGSSDICIEIQGGGRQLIRISDNGCGMNRDDALLCLERHATSKLRDVEDIHSLSTMGFRGEAIPSIASISKFNLLTSPSEVTSPSTKEPSGTMIIIDGGKILSCHSAIRAKGTTIEVKSLFFNVPVRKKFLKSPSFDANEILKTVSIISLGNPEIKFQLIHDGKQSLNTFPATEHLFSEKLKASIKTTLGNDFYENTEFIEEKQKGLSIEGFIGKPIYHRHNRSGQYLFINRRAVSSPTISYAIKEAFGTSIPSGRFPAFVLHLTLPGEMVDINVHPQKKEVRLRQEPLIKDIIIKAVRNKIHPSTLNPSAFTTSSSDEEFFPTHNYPQERIDFTSPSNYPEWTFQPKTHFQANEDDYFENKKIESLSETEYLDKKNLSNSSSLFNHIDIPLKSSRATESFSFSTSNEAPLKVLTTVSHYMIIDPDIHHPFIKNGCKQAEKGGIFLVDQKNAHARVLYEKLIEESSPLAQQMLLIPHSLQLTQYESKLITPLLPALNKMGIRMKEFGTHTFLVDAIPEIFGNTNLEQLVADIVRDLCHMQTEGTEGQLLRQKHAKSICTAATRSAVSLKQRLSQTEAQLLLEQLVKCNQPYFCPSGKPTLAQISGEEMIKFFHKHSN